MEKTSGLPEIEASVAEAERLLARLGTCPDEPRGLGKLRKNIRQELLFLRKLLSSSPGYPAAKVQEHLRCSNLVHLRALVDAVTSCSPLAVLEKFSYSGDSVVVDLVSDGGATWTKVVARSPEDAEDEARLRFGQRSLVHQAGRLVSAAALNPHRFRPPQVRLLFSRGLPDPASTAKLKALGAVPLAAALGPHSDPDPGQDPAEADDRVLNLDVTALVAYVSDLTNGRDDVRFEDPLLDQQAAWERLKPAKAQLDRAFSGKSLICCESAAKGFWSIVDTLAGPGERSRALELFDAENGGVRVVPDQPSARFRKLRVSGKISARSLAVFGTGDSLGAATVSANGGFVRAALNQGVRPVVVLHEARALTELKVLSSGHGEDLSGRVPGGGRVGDEPGRVPGQVPGGQRPLPDLHEGLHGGVEQL